MQQWPDPETAPREEPIQTPPDEVPVTTPEPGTVTPTTEPADEPNPDHEGEDAR